MKTAFHHRTIYCLLAASVGLNIWLWNQAASKQESDSSPKQNPATADQQLAGAAMRGPIRNNPPDQASGAMTPNESQSPGGRPAEKFSEDAFLYGVTPVQPELPEDTIPIDRWRQIAAQKPSAETWNVQLRLLLKTGENLELGTLKLQEGQRGRFGRIKEFPHPEGFELADSPKDGPISPATPSTFVFVNTGITIELEATADGGAVILGGRFLHRTFVGFNRMPGELFLPISDGKGALLTDNKMLLPRFDVGESPFMAAPTVGKPCLVPVQTVAGLAQLELTCTAAE